MGKKLTVFISGAGTATTVSIIKGLRQQKEIDVTICVCDASENVAGRYFADQFYKVPHANDPLYLEVLLQSIKKSNSEIFSMII